MEEFIEARRLATQALNRARLGQRADTFDLSVLVDHLAWAIVEHAQDHHRRRLMALKSLMDHFDVNALQKSGIDA